MNLRLRNILAFWSVFGAASVVLAAEQKVDDKVDPVFTLVAFFLPIVIIIGCMLLFARKAGAKQGKLLTRADEHMDRIERQTDRMVQLLESIDQRLRSDRP